MADCSLKQLPDESWWCPVCDPNRKDLLRPGLYPYRRRCHVRNNGKATIRGRLEYTLPGIPKDQPEIRAHVQAILAETTGPTLTDKAKHYAAAVVHWCAAGCPVRSPQLQEACRVTCQGCPSDQFDPETETCKVCGCSVRKSLLAVRDKVAMATEDCPKGHWPKA